MFVFYFKCHIFVPVIISVSLEKHHCTLLSHETMIYCKQIWIFHFFQYIFYFCLWVNVLQSSWQYFQIFTEKNMLIITDLLSKSPHPHLLSVWRSLTPLVSPASSLQHYTVTMLALLISRQCWVIREHCSFILLIVFTSVLHKVLERETTIHPTVHELKW